MFAKLVSDNETLHEGSNSCSEPDDDFTLTRKRQRRNTSGKTGPRLSAFHSKTDIDVGKLSIDETLSTIFNTLMCNQQTILHLERKMNTVIKMNKKWSV